MKRVLGLVLVMLMVLALVPTVALAAGAVIEVGAADDLAAALSTANSGDTVKITADRALTTTYVIKTGVTLTADPGVEITVSGSNTIFNMQTGAIIDGLTILKTDKTTQAQIIYMKTDCVVENCSVTGQFVIGDGETSRAIVVESGAADINIEGNTFRALRQPAYINGGVTGTVNNNNLFGTKGWVVCIDALCTFTGNSFGGNVIDIAVIPNGSAANAHAYDDVAAISAANNGAYVENQVTGFSAASGVVFPTGTGKSTAVNSSVDPTYTIIIPASVDFGTLIKGSGVIAREFDVTAQDLVLESGSHVDVSVQSSFLMSDGATPPTTLEYLLYNTAADGSPLSTGAQFASFTTSGTQDGRVTVDTGAITNAGSYSGTMVFTIAYVG